MQESKQIVTIDVSLVKIAENVLKILADSPAELTSGTIRVYLGEPS